MTTILLRAREHRAQLASNFQLIGTRRARAGSVSERFQFSTTSNSCRIAGSFRKPVAPYHNLLSIATNLG
ncbi:MAG: hypothetical protein WB992_01580, partial [Bryobacteraceae bacterium]